MRNTDNILRLLTTLSNDLSTGPTGRIGLDDGCDLVDEVVKTVTDLLGASSTGTRKGRQ